MTLGSNDSDSFTYDANTGRVTQFQFSVNSQSLTGTIGWNPLGTPSSLDIADAFNSTDTQNCSFAHDDLTRLAKVNCGTIWGQSFTYDAFGNITKTVLSGSSGTSFQPTYANPSTNRIASLPSFTPTYDANGNLTKDPQHQYGWDSEGRPVTIDTVTSTYDALDRVVEQNNAGTYTQIVYSPLGVKFGFMNGQTLKKAFAPLPDGGIAAYTASGLAYYRHPDWLGSSRLASTPTRGIYSDTAYAPFGEPYAQSGTADPSFTSQNQDTTSNLYDFLYREDSSIQGRWISPDPAGLTAVSLTDPQSWNRYAYVRNSPVNLIDSIGLQCVWDDGSFDSADDPETGSKDLCESQSNGGTWVDPGSFDAPGGLDWNPNPDPQFAQLIFGEADWTNPVLSETDRPLGNFTGTTLWWYVTFTSDFFSPSAIMTTSYNTFADPGGCGRVVGNTIAHDLLPIPDEPGLGTLTDNAKGGAYLMGLYRAGAYGNSQQLTMPLRSSIYRSLRGTAVEFGEIAETYAFPVLVVGSATHAIVNTASAAYNGECH
jgi:RHS repeat-associated protein